MTDPRPVLALAADLIFAARIRAAAEAHATTCILVRSGADLVSTALHEAPRLILIDLDLRSEDAPALIRRIREQTSDAPLYIVAFGSHVRGDVLAAARAAGADRVLARSAFVRQLPALLD